MWNKTYSKKVKGISAEDAWKVWTDVNQWHTWKPDCKYAQLEGDFKVGNTFRLKPKSGPAVSIELVEVEPGQQFTDLTRFLGARMYGSHEFLVSGDELEIRTTLRVEGFLSFLWIKLVAQGIANGLEKQTEALIEKVKKH